MTILYVDSSALVKLVASESNSAVLADAIDGAELVVSAIAVAEVPRALRRQADDRVWSVVWDRVLAGLRLLAVDRALLARAGRLAPPELRALDALHLASALSIGAALTAVVAYDRRLLMSAEDAGLATWSPGLDR